MTNRESVERPQFYAFASVKLQTVVAEISPLTLSSIAVAEKPEMIYIEERNLQGKSANPTR